MSDDELLGTSLTLTLDGQRVVGTVTDVRPRVLVVTVPVRQSVGDSLGSTAAVALPDGRSLTVDMAKACFYTTLVLEVPRPESQRADEPAKTGSERRHFFRYNIELPVDVVENVGHTRQYVRAGGRTLNLSGGGMLLDLTKALLPGVYRFKLYLPNEEMLLVGRVLPGKDGVVASKTAVEFEGIHEVDRSRLIRFIFARMRGAKLDSEAAEGADGETVRESLQARFRRRHDKYFKPSKIRYW